MPGAVEPLAHANYRPSRYNNLAWEGGSRERGALLIYNSLSGAFVRIDPPLTGEILEILDGDAFSGPLVEPLDALVRQGLLVRTDIDELDLVGALEHHFKTRNDVLNLILMPTEKCNFRCLYCYEDFVKGRMAEDVRSGVVELVKREIGSLRKLNIDWFGGEPLTAMGVVTEISRALLQICHQNGVSYSASMTTNGSLLTKSTADECLALGVERYQITLDGPPESHDTLRVLANGGETFETIWANLVAMRNRPDDFRVRIRVNYTPEVVAKLPAFLARVGPTFGNDDRFSIWFHPVGKWGGPHDAEINTCDEGDVFGLELELMDAAATAGFDTTSWRQALAPFGSTCYAADPRSFVIGSDGSVYKCTVALKDEENHVGRLAADGRLELRDDRMALWVESGAQVDQGCQACGFRPACHGDACPLERMRQGHRACPPIKTNLSRVLPIIAVTSVRA